MKILLDSCVYGKATEALRVLGQDVIWAGSWERDPGDSEILNIARSEARVLVTLDKDFGELAIHRGERHAGIIRLVNIPAREQATLCAHILGHHEQDLLKEAIITADRQRIRVRKSEA